MTGVLALFGSGEFTKSMASVDKHLLSKVSLPKVAIFPTAAGFEDTWPKWITDGEKHYRNMGASASGFEVIDKKSANDKAIAKDLEDYNFFVFSGGDPGYLLQTLKNSLIWKKIYEKFQKGSTLVGSSAGAMVMGRKVWGSIYKYDRENKLLPWDDGLGITDFGILPHFDEIEDYLGTGRYQKAIENLPKDIGVIGIDENTAYIKAGDKWSIKGKQKVHILRKF